MKKQLHLTRATLTVGVLVGSLTLLQAGDHSKAGGMAKAPAYAPPSDCDSCNEPGFYLNAAALYLNSVAESDGYDGDWDLGGRLGIGYERPDGLFYEIEGFWWEGDAFRPGWPDVNYDVEHVAIDFLVGDNLYCGEVCLDIAFGVRYASYEREGRYAHFDKGWNKRHFHRSGDSFDFDGWGPTIELTATRQLDGPWSLYGEFQQSLLFGETSGSSRRRGGGDSDTLASITEIAAGVQYSLGSMMGGLKDAYIRLGGEAQYWVIDGNDVGLYGASLGFGSTF
ncbi:MAG: hypothetical protein HKN82_06030 [Akkermansiaceae bacterium]|nr:hypothetical protein [Akkermansiaceae bacterium]